ncbi:MAG: alpha/beta fold hydrolase [Rhodospirillales bacterium]|jgi:pimeloyl-ACP methyl ester carboxylesterase|nr:alpha/beta fold hydrolase [Rhodospirillales bacterium]MBT5075530.1 alpha/beta fold hydrolase [Rhodospirillales bacterium]MBT5112497.1 alpha/beta fold hydrolase [Rhodospirillales bacterium]MBT5673366.1 alpha/beta fold hydrolase [Rhodospirillales bacterium]MBT6186809.1 alpha/beta fold hydrolase [Rhodospirillales bacterium]
MSDIWSEEYTATKKSDGGDVSLYMFRKHNGAPDKNNPRPVLFLIHGSSFSGPSGFDMKIKGHDDYSLMDAFANLGYDVWTLDHEGYGRSDRTGGNAPISEGVRDIEAGIDVVKRETGLDKYFFYGQSSGALRLACFAANNPDRVARCVLDAFVWTGEGAPTLIERRKKLDQWRGSNTRPVNREFYHSIFNRDLAGTSDDAVPDALADAELPLCSEVPTGTYLDMCANLPVVNPWDITCPVMILRGEHDGIASEEDLFNFFMKLPNTDCQFVIIAGQAHVAPLGINRKRFWHAMDGFFQMPERLDPHIAEDQKVIEQRRLAGNKG